MFRKNEKTLIANAAVSDATKIQFELSAEDFEDNSYPSVRTQGLSTDDTVTVYEWINGAWEAGIALSESLKQTAITSYGIYAVDIALTTSVDASVILTTSREHKDG